MSNREIIDELKSGIKDFKGEMQKHTESIYQQLNSLRSETRQQDLILEKKHIQRNQLVEDLKSVNTKIETVKDEIERNTLELANQQKKIEELRSMNIKLQSTKRENTTELEDVLKHNTLRVDSSDQLTEKIVKFENHLSKLKNSTEDNIAKSHVKVEKARTDLSTLGTEFAIWAYLLEKTHNPEIDIMAFLSSKEGVSIDDIKSGIKTVQPVFISRALNKLETDGKVRQDQSGKWEISPPFLVLMER